jgi:hypothetical protein
LILLLHIDVSWLLSFRGKTAILITRKIKSVIF